MDGDERTEGIERVGGLRREDFVDSLLAALKDVDAIIDDEAMVAFSDGSGTKERTGDWGSGRSL